jgi:hypothetical protein
MLLRQNSMHNTRLPIFLDRFQSQVRPCWMLWTKWRCGSLPCQFSAHQLSTLLSRMLPSVYADSAVNKNIRLAKRSKTLDVIMGLSYHNLVEHFSCACASGLFNEREVGNKYFLNVGNRRNWVVNFTLRMLYPWRKWHCYPLDSNLVVHQNLFWRRW